MAGKVGTLIKDARTRAGMTQEELARKIKGISADDISLAERGEKDLTQAVLKEIAKITGVTQKSLIEAAKGSSSKKSGSSSSKKSSSSSSHTSGSSSSKKSSTSSSKKSSTSSSKKSSTSSDSFKLSAEEKKLVQAYRGSDDKVKATIKMLLLGTESLTSGSGGFDMPGAADFLGSLVGSLKNLL